MKAKITILLLSIILIFTACPEPIWIKTTGQKIEKDRFNIIGILGEESDTAYIELMYSEANGQSSNKIIHKWVKPPVIVGGHYTNVTYNELSSNGAMKYAKEAIIDYSEGNSHYMKIINHGKKPVEYFVAGAHPVRIVDLNKIFPDGLHKDSRVVPPVSMLYDIYPTVLYKNASIYFLLNPIKKPSSNQYVMTYSTFEGDCCYAVDSYQTIYFEGDKIGNIMVKNAWNINKIMDLYRQEYNSKAGTLKLKYSEIDHYNDKENIKEYILSKSKRIYYGFIQAGDSVQSNEKNPFITHFCGHGFDHCICKVDYDYD